MKKTDIDLVRGALSGVLTEGKCSANEARKAISALAPFLTDPTEGGMPERAGLFDDGWKYSCECGGASFWILAEFIVCQGCQKGVAMLGTVPIYPNWEIRKWPERLGIDGQPEEITMI